MEVMPLSAPKAKSRAGFTMVEVVVSIGVFSLVLLVGFAGVGQMLNLQRDVYQRTVAASFIMTLGQWRAQQFQLTMTNPLLLTEWESSKLLTRIPFANLPKVVNDDTVFAGGTTKDYDLTTTITDDKFAKWFIVDPSTSETPPPPATGKYDLSAYSNLIIFKSESTKESVPNGDGMNYVMFSIWQGTRGEFSDTGATRRRLRFLGRYVMQDGRQ